MSQAENSILGLEDKQNINKISKEYGNFKRTQEQIINMEHYAKKHIFELLDSMAEKNFRSMAKTISSIRS